MNIFIFISRNIALRVSLGGHLEKDLLGGHPLLVIAKLLSKWFCPFTNPPYECLSSCILTSPWSALICFVTGMSVTDTLLLLQFFMSLMMTAIEYHIIHWHLFRFLPELLVPALEFPSRFLDDLEEFLKMFPDYSLG